MVGTLMGVSFKFTGDKGLKKLLAKMSSDAEAAVIEVGYTANYAIYVHEMGVSPPKDINWNRPGSGNKFLEKPFRQLRKELTTQIGKDRKTMTLKKALYVAGLRLQRASQMVCPVDKGNLRASAFTRYRTK